ncbi:heparinase II/III family protein [Lentisphaerota bacterium WC36G]|nr:heparinase II/III family protein [Lentisphaerae bacterium WC36]
MRLQLLGAMVVCGLIASTSTLEVNAKENSHKINKMTKIQHENLKHEISEALKNMRTEHPRLIMTDEMFAERKKLLKTDENMQFYYATIKKQADKILEKPLLKHHLRDGIRMLGVSRDMMDRVYKLGIVWKMTGDDKYAECARKNLLSVVAFKDWNPRHFLDTAEMSNAVGVGYDWFYHYLSEDDRDIIRKGLIKNGLTPNPKFAVVRTNNWNVVCNGGLIIGALAIADTNPEFAQKIIERAVKNMPNCLAHFAPDGGWFEGPGYWGYTARYFAMSMAAMETSIGTDFGLTKLPGLAMAAEFPVYSSDNEGRYFRFADVGKKGSRGGTGPIFWFANKYNNLALAQNEDKFARIFGAKQYHFLWYNPKMNNRSLVLEKDKLFRGDVPTAIFTNLKKQPQDIWIAAKAGTNGLAHGHLDVGSFEVTINGVRWLADMGADFYNLPGYWEGEVGGRRWSYPRIATEAHNVPMINDKDQVQNASATVEKFVSKEDYAFWTLNMTKLYSDAKSVKRGIALYDKRNDVLIRDEFILKKKSNIKWTLITGKNVEVNKNKVILTDTKTNKKLLIVFNSNAKSFKVVTNKVPYTEPAHPTDKFTRIQIIFDVPSDTLVYFDAKFANNNSSKNLESNQALFNESITNW